MSENRLHALASVKDNCPYFDCRLRICRAAKQATPPTQAHQDDYCESDDHDDCPLYLCQALRGSQPLGYRDSLVASGK